MSRPTRIVDYGGQTPNRHEESSALTVGDASVRSCAGCERVAIADLQRTRILDAVVEVVAERGIGRSSVSLVVARASVSRRTFYECFASLEDATVAVMDGALEQLSALASHALAAEECWRDGMRSALAAVLAFFDARPALAQVCIVQALGGGPVVLARREYLVSAFRALVVAKIESQVAPASPLAAEGVMASVMGIVHTHIVTEQSGPLIELLGPLMGLATALYLDDSEVQREIERGRELARELLERRPPQAAHRADTRVRVPDELLSARAHHARLCLQYVAQQNEQGLSPSNQQVGEGIGLSHRGQVARLLGKLAALGLLVKRSAGAGYPNAWSATPQGKDVADYVAEQL
jgi:AcrR family transcriptional regulator